VCIANAVADALGRRDVGTPLKPTRILEWLSEAEPPRRQDRPARQPGLAGSGGAMASAEPAQVWEALLRPEVLQQAIPGCRTIEQTGPHAYAATVMLGVGPVRGRFDAQVALSELDRPRFAVLSGRLTGPLGAARGQGRLTLTPAPGGTTIAYDYDIELTGHMAMVGGRLIEGATRHLVGEFFRRLAAALGAPRSGSGDGRKSFWRGWVGKS